MARRLQAAFILALLAIGVTYAGINDQNKQAQQAATDAAIVQANTAASERELKGKLDTSVFNVYTTTSLARYSNLTSANNARFKNQSTVTQRKLDDKQPTGNYLTGVAGDCSVFGPGLASIICTKSNGSAFGSAAFTLASAYEPTITPGTTLQYLRGDKTWQAFPSIPAAQINSDWNAVSGLGQILNRPTLGGFASLTPGTLTNTDLCTSNGTTIACTTPTSNFLGATAQAADSAKLGGTLAATVVAGAASGATAVQPGGALGTPASGTLTSCTGLPESGVTNLTTDLAGKAATGQTMYIGTTAHAINRAGASEALTGITSIDGSAVSLSTPNTAPNAANFFETGTWTVVATGLTVVGTPTYTGTYTKIGNRIYGEIKIYATTSTASTNKITSFNLPYAAAYGVASGLVNAADYSSAAVYPGGLVGGDAAIVYAPTWPAAPAMVLSFSYQI